MCCCAECAGSTTTQKGHIDPSKRAGGYVTTAGVVVIVLVCLAAVAGAVVGTYCFLRVRKLQAHEQLSMKMKGNLLEQDEETFDAHEI